MGNSAQETQSRPKGHTEFKKYLTGQDQQMVVREKYKFQSRCEDHRGRINIDFWAF